MVRAKVVTVMRWYAQDELNQEDSEQNEVDGTKKRADSIGKVKERLVICNEEDTDVTSSKGDNRWGYACTVKRNQIVQVFHVRFAGSENFIGIWKEFIFYAFINPESVQRSKKYVASLLQSMT